MTLNGGGNPNALFVFQAGSTLITASASSVNLINGAQACNVFWQVGSSATLGTGSTFRGTILALTSITVTTGTTINGRVLARNGAVTLDTDTITKPTCTTLRTATTVPGGTADTGHGQGQRQDPQSDRHGQTGTGRPPAGRERRPAPTGSGTLPFTGINPRLPILGGSLVVFGLRPAGPVHRTAAAHERLNHRRHGNARWQSSASAHTTGRGGHQSHLGRVVVRVAVSVARATQPAPAATACPQV